MPTDKHLSASKIQTFLPAVVRQSKSMGIFLEYYVLNPETDAMERKRMRLQKVVKKYKKTHEQMMAARNICEEVNRKLSGGWTPLQETEDGRLYTKIQDLRERFLTHKKAEGLRPATLQSYSSMTGLFLSWCEDTGRARKMSGTFLKIDAVSYMDYILDKGFSNRSYNNTVKTLKVFFSWAKENCYCKENPFEYIKPLPKEKKRRTLIDHETRQRLSDFLSSYSPQFLIVCKLIYYSAMRPKEIANIQIRDIDIKNRCIHVHEDIAKNGKSRCATLTEDLILSLIPVLQSPLPGNWYLFGSNQQITPAFKRVALSNFRKKWDKVREILRLPQSMQLYSLRDSGITDFLHAGIDPLTVQHHADHSSLAVQNIYTDHYDPNLNATIYEKAPSF